MKTITVRNLTLQFDANQITAGSDQSQAQEAIELINDILQRQPFGLGAQIMTIAISGTDVEASESEEEGHE